MIGVKWDILFSSALSQKLINISSEVVNIHIIPTQTKHFQTTYTKKVFFIRVADLNSQDCCCCCLWRFNTSFSSLVLLLPSEVSTDPRPRLHAAAQLLSRRVALLLRLRPGSLQGGHHFDTKLREHQRWKLDWVSSLCFFPSFHVFSLSCDLSTLFVQPACTFPRGRRTC